MAIVVRCPAPACRAACSVAEARTGRPVKCPKCGKAFFVKPTIDGPTSDTNKGQPSLSPDPFPALPAQFGRYQVVRLLGRGGMGAVYLAEDSQLGRQVALKMPFLEASQSQRVERFVREARSAAALQHPNICTVFDAGQIDGRPFITMAYVAGRPLADEIDPESPMPQRRAAEVARKIALALEQAHHNGIVHRDLKPANVIVAAEGEPVVMDFGLAKRVAEVDAHEARLTRDGGIVGTPSYMSPEQLKGQTQAIGPASDIYSLGVMLFEMLTGRPPYAGPIGVLVGRILAAPVPPVREFRPDVDPRLDDICQKAMAKDPAARFADMAQLADALDQYLKAPSSSPPPLPATQTQQVKDQPSAVRDTSLSHRGSRSRVVLGLVAAGLVAVLAAGAWLSVRPDHGEVSDLNEPSDEVDVKLTLRPKVAADAKKPPPAWPAVPKKGDVVTNSIGMRLAYIPPGTFQMGSPQSEQDEAVRLGSPRWWVDLERPQRTVEISRGFYLGIHEVTQEQYTRVMGRNPSHFKGERNLPVEQVSWNDAVQFAQKLSELPEERGRVYRLPTEAEWEYACRGPAASYQTFHTGNSLSSEQANFNGDNPFGEAPRGVSRRKTLPVGSFAANGFGLFDMHGNVWEWCWDWHDPTCYAAGPARDPVGPAAAAYKVLRGGGWDNEGHLCRAATRSRRPREYTFSGVGFRVAVLPFATAGPDNQPADRKAAEYVLSIGGRVHVNSEGREINAVTDLPREGFRLTRVDLPANPNVTDAGLACFRGCQNLRWISLSSTVVTDGGLAHFKECKGLTFLWLNNTAVSDAGLAHFQDCKALGTLSLNGTRVTDAGLVHVKGLPNLTALSLWNTKISDAALTHIGALKQLKVLQFFLDPVTDDGLARLKDLTRLESLDLNATKVTDAGLIHLKALTSLKDLNLMQTQVTGEGFAHLQDLSNLQVLYLAGSKVGDRGLEHLKHLSRLRAIDLTGTAVTEAGAAELRKALPACRIHTRPAE